ncbi:helix-turn-helix transcriptional regulator [Micromonospora cremea]|nr:helix-turn-helix domain-containing protein [Micromonospora cremea]
MTTEDLARLLKVDPSTVRRWRTAKPAQGPPFIKLSERVTMYNVDDVERWLLILQRHLASALGVAQA